jgi:cell division protein FtsW
MSTRTSGRAPSDLSSRLPVDDHEPPESRFVPPGRSTNTFWLLLSTVVVLNMIGLVMVMSASSVVSLEETGSTWSYFLKQALWTVFGVGALLVLLFTDITRWRRAAPWLLYACIGLLGAVMFVGNEANGATRWIAIGPVVVQPSEFAKLGLVLFVADLLTRRANRMHDPVLTVWPVLGYLGVMSVLILAQPNLGTTIVLAAATLTVLYIAGGPGKAIAACAAVSVFVAGFMVYRTPFRKARFLAFLDPWADAENTGYQVIQSGVGFADGGLWGSGLGTSRAKYDWLPFAHTDFIYAIIGEELGLVGAVLVVALIGALGVFGFRTALRAEERFGMLIAAGITTWFMTQAFINIGAVTGMMPITGVPLPFISAGGSSLLVNLAATGLLLNVARHPRPESSRVAIARDQLLGSRDDG